MVTSNNQGIKNEMVSPDSMPGSLSQSPTPSENERGRRKRPRINYSEADLFEKQLRLLAKNELQLEVTPNLRPEEEEEEEKNVTFKNKLKLVDSDGQWCEPPLAQPTPGATGLPLDSFPTNKIKKEALWPRRKNNGRRKSKKPEENKEEALESEDEQEPESHGDLEKKYEINLKTRLSEPITRLSIERIPDHELLKPVVKRGAAEFQDHSSQENSTSEPHTLSKIILKVPSTPSKKQQQTSKKIKRSPQKNRGNAYGYGTPDLAGQKRAGAFDFEDRTKDNEDFCSACGGPGIFLCCEACPKSFHFVCCDPPLDENSLPEGNWYCNECSAKRKKTKKYNVGIFSKLLNQAEKRDPRKFQLPRYLRESTFEDVSTSATGEYQDASSIKNSRPVRVGKLEEYEATNIYDKNGNPLICYKCGKSGLSKQIAKCGHCDLSWHLDCLDPPLPALKTLGTKWKCPNHVTDLIPNKKRRFKKQPVVDVSMSRGFRNNGDIEIVNLSDEEGEDVIELPIPDYFKTFYRDGEVHAPVGQEMDKIITTNNVTYRIPEKGIILDFIDNSKIKKLRELKKVTEENRKILEQLQESKEDTKTQYVESLAQFHEKPVVSNSSPGFKFEDLLSAVDSELSATALDLPLSEDEIKELKYLKKLIEIKGKDKVLDFLKI